jgi:hypothetical protein
LSAQSFEVTLARLYTDPVFRKQFLLAPEKTLMDCDLTISERADMMAIDKTGLIMAAHSFLHKRKTRLLKRNKITQFKNTLKKWASLVRETR